MNRRDLAPGHRLFVLSGEVEPGDVLHEHGPRIGSRYWSVVFVEFAVKYWHAAVERVEVDELPAMARDGAQMWNLS